MSRPNNPLARPADDPMRQWKTPTDAKGLDRLGGLIMAQINHSLPRVLAGAGPRMVRALISEVQRNPGLADCTPLSLFGGVLAAAQMGLVIGGPAGEAYLLPFNNRKKNCKEVTLVVGYKGYVTLAHRSDRLRRITPVRVREGDRFEFTRGLENRLVHHPQRDNDRPVTDYYVAIELTNGGTDFEHLTVREATAHRDRFATSRQFKSGPWYDPDGFHEMALKTCVRKLAKRMPLSVELVTAAALDEAGDEGVPQHLAAYLPPDVQPADDPPGSPDDLARRLDAADDPPPAPPGKLFDDADADLSALKN
jgi:recombination protein RecT